MPDDVMTVREAAEALGVTEATVRHHIARGRLPVERHGPRVLLLHRADVEAFRSPKAGWPRGKARKPAPEAARDGGGDGA